MSNPGKNPASQADDDREIVSTRVFAMPREQVFAAFADPARLAQWWGPKGFTNTFHQFDLRPGGAWRFTMHGPNGAAYEMDKQFTEVVRPERIVVRHFHQTHDFILTMTFATHDRGTELTWVMCFADAAECAKVRAFIIPANEENFDRLAQHLAPSTPKS